MTVTKPPQLHPLAQSLGYDWRWLLDEARSCVVILHPTGLFFEIPREALAPGRFTRRDTDAIRTALDTGISDGLRGEVSIKLIRSASSARARLERSVQS